MDYPLLLYYCKPNGYGESEYFLYDGDLARVVPAPNDRRARGYYMRYSDMRRTRAAVLFGHGGQLYLDLGEGPFNIDDADIRVRRRLNFKKVQIQAPGRRFETWIHTPIWRYLTNDGQFPEEVEPFIETLDDLRNPEQRMRQARRMSEGF